VCRLPSGRRPGWASPRRAWCTCMDTLPSLWPPTTDVARHTTRCEEGVGGLGGQGSVQERVPTAGADVLLCLGNGRAGGGGEGGGGRGGAHYKLVGIRSVC
jgi:hypothetical protein